MSIEREVSDYPLSRGSAAIGARLRRLSERIDRETGQVYAAMGVQFEQRWFGPFNQLIIRGTSSVGEIAGILGISHAAVSQVCSALHRAGLIASSSDPDDARRRMLSLSAKGQTLARQMAPTWARLEAVSRELEAEADGLIDRLGLLEAALDRASIVERARSRTGEGD